MGPFVPDLISDQLNLVVALVLGIAFGFVLEQAGFSSSRRLAGVFYGYDFTVLRVFFTAAVTAMIGVLLLGYAGLLDTDAIFVNPTWLWPGHRRRGHHGGRLRPRRLLPRNERLRGGDRESRRDVLRGRRPPRRLRVRRGLSRSSSTFDDSSFARSREGVRLRSASPQGAFAFLLIAAAVTAFAATTWIEKRVAPVSAPSLRFARRPHVLAGAALLVLGGVLLVLPDYKSRLLARVSDGAYAGAHPVPVMTADELAFRIVDHEPNVRIVDVRSPQAWTARSLPGSVNVGAARSLQQGMERRSFPAPRPQGRRRRDRSAGADRVPPDPGAGLRERRGPRGRLSELREDDPDTGAVRAGGRALGCRRPPVSGGRARGDRPPHRRRPARRREETESEKKIQGGC